MKGALTPRAERERIARDLRAQGLLMREIAAEMGVAVSTVSDYLNDPGGHRLAARKKSYRGVCEVCGGPTNGSNGPSNPGSVCQKCRSWTREQIIDAIRAWAESHGGIPPTCTDWLHADVDHPHANSVIKRFGSWNEALLEAGFALRRDLRPETQQWIEEQALAGVPLAEIGRQLGTSRTNIGGRLRRRGISVQQLRRDGVL